MADRSLRFIQGCARRVCLLGGVSISSGNLSGCSCLPASWGCWISLTCWSCKRGMGSVPLTTHAKTPVGDFQQHTSTAYCHAIPRYSTSPHNMQLELADAIARPHGGHECSFLRQYITSWPVSKLPVWGFDFLSKALRIVASLSARRNILRARERASTQVSPELFTFQVWTIGKAVSWYMFIAGYWSRQPSGLPKCFLFRWKPLMAWGRVLGLKACFKNVVHFLGTFNDHI